MKKIIIILFIAFAGNAYSQEVSKDSIATLKLREKILKLNTKVNQYQQVKADRANDIIGYQNKLKDYSKKEIKASEEAKKMALEVRNNTTDEKLAKKASKAYKNSSSASKDVIKYQNKITDAEKDIAKLNQKITELKTDLSSLESKIKFIKN